MSRNFSSILAELMALIEEKAGELAVVMWDGCGCQIPPATYWGEMRLQVSTHIEQNPDYEEHASDVDVYYGGLLCATWLSERQVWIARRIVNDAEVMRSDDFEQRGCEPFKDFCQRVRDERKKGR